MKNIKLMINDLRLIIKYWYVIPRVLKSKINAIIYNKGTLLSVMFYITDNCQCKCKHCYNTRYYNKDISKKIGIEDIKKVVIDSRKLGAININFVGGEPLLHPNICEAISFSVKKGMVVNVLTNGKLLNLANIKKYKRLGVQTFFVSLDYLDERHDKFRGKKGLKKTVLKNINNCKKCGQDVIINYVLTSERIKDGSFDEMIEYVKKNNFFLNINFPYKIGNWENDSKNDLRLDEELMVKKKYRNILKFHDDRYLTDNCCAGSEKIVITSNGDVIPCELLRIKFGNIYKESIIDIYNRLYNSKTLDTLRGVKWPCRKTKFIERYFNKLKKIKDYREFENNEKNRISR